MRRLLLLTFAALLLAAPAQAHKANPNYLSVISGIEPGLDGVRLEMVNRDDAISLVNRSDQDITVLGYDDKEDYARVLADGTVEVNTNSKAFYLNEDRFATTVAPKNLPATPNWKVLSKSHKLEWHDHRSHWMAKTLPPAVKDKSVKTKVFDWKVPVKVGTQPAAIQGELFWTPTAGGGAPVGAIIAGAVIVILLSIMVIVVRRRREAEAGDEAGPGKPAAEGAGEAW
jgi:hypothetical protein